ncbi:ribosome biogenesis GTPase Der, partial [bacterium]|nr:ribosome biogenesis GTPase Der [bacterium]
VHDAIEEADVLIFVVDAKVGLTALDQDLAQRVKKIGSSVLLAVNKVDNESIDLQKAEFYRLGLGEPISLSALNSRRVGDFLDAVHQVLPDRGASQNGSQDAVTSIAVVGRPNVGKSSYINALLGEQKHIVTEIPGTTRDAIDTKFKYYGQDFVLVDTAGLRKKSKVKDDIEFYSSVRSFQSIQQCHVAVLIIDATLGMETQDLRILEEAVRLNKGVVIAVNKWDLVEKDTNTARDYEIKLKETLKSKDFLPILFISALQKQRVFKVLDIVKSVRAERQRVVRTSELNEFLLDVTRRYPPPSNDRKEVKIKYCTQVKSDPPVMVFFANAPDSIKANYRAYLEKQLRKRFGFFGVPLSLIFRKK